MWLEEHRIPYRVVKVRMDCQSTKSWYEEIHPKCEALWLKSLCAVELDGKAILGEDDKPAVLVELLTRLEGEFGLLNGSSIMDKQWLR